MTVFSTINCAAVALLALSASGTKIHFNLKSDGKYWYGARWKHTPYQGHTNDCVCVKGAAPGLNLGVKCIKGMRDSFTMDVPFDFSNPIDITIHGRDGLWVDRFSFETKSGRRDFGRDNTSGWCLSKDKNERFDEYATHSGCSQTLSFWKGNIRRFDDTQYRMPSNDGKRDIYVNFRFEQLACEQLKSHRVGTQSVVSWIRNGRRRVEGSDGEGLEPPVLPVDVVVANDSTLELETVDDSEYDDPDPTGEHPTQAHNHADALVLQRLHQEIKKLVRDNSDVTDAQIDQTLNSAMLDVEHILEREEHEGEVLEPEGSEGGIVAADGSVVPNTTPEALEGSTTTNSKNDRGVEGRLQDLEESP